MNRITNQVLAVDVLIALATPGGGRAVYSMPGKRLLVNGIELPHSVSDWSSEVWEIRGKYFLEKLGLSGADLWLLGESWLDALAGHKLSGRQLREIGQKTILALDVSTKSQLTAWRQAVEARIKESSPSLSFVEHLSPNGNQHSEPVLALAPILQQWPERLTTHPEWSCAESPLPEIPPLPLDEVWVDLHITEPLEQNTFEDNLLPQIMEQRYRDNLWLNMPADFVLETLSGVMVLVGAPGVGKTTLMKWIARNLLQQSEGRFLLPLFVPLRAYALSRAQQPDIDLLSFAVGFCGVESKQQIDQWVSVISDLSGTERNTVLLLLDGWDEVPDKHKEALTTEIKKLGYTFSIIITSRPSAYPKALPHDQLYEISDLPPENIVALIRQWHDLMEQPRQADILLEHLKKHPDLFKLARNPFLLNLLCAINLGAKSDVRVLPKNRSELYAHTLEHIYSYHNDNPKFPVPFDRDCIQGVQALALWLLAEAPNHPQYIFGQQEVEQVIGDVKILNNVLKPSRLLSQWHLSKESLHFLHTTFQEYLAAEALLREDNDKFVRLITHEIYNPAWQEILQFIAGNRTRFEDDFWQLIRPLFSRSDQCGLIDIRLSQLVAETGAIDGGRSLLGYDLRDKLWGHIKSGIATERFVEAYARLDAPDFVRKANTDNKFISERLRARITRSLKKIPTRESSQAIVDRLLSDDLKEAAVASYAVEGVLDAEGIYSIRSAVLESQRSDDAKTFLIRALGNHRDFTSIPALIQVYEEVPELGKEVFRALGAIGGEKGAEALASILHESTDLDQRREVVNALGRAFDLPARNVLMTELAKVMPDDPIVSDILEALCEIPISRHSELICLYLDSCFSEDIREQAIWALMGATEVQVTEKLARLGEHDPSGKIRVAALAALKNRARSYDITWLAPRVRDEGCNPLERANALEALFGFCKRVQQGQVTAHLDHSHTQDILMKLTVLSLARPAGELTVTAATGAYLLGREVAQELLAVCENDKFSLSTREAACLSLGKLGYKSGIGLLIQWVEKEPNLIDDEEEAFTEVDQRLARAAAQAWVQIDLLSAVRHKAKTIKAAVSKFALDHGYLIFDDRMISPLGKVFDYSSLENSKKALEVIDLSLLLDSKKPAVEQQDRMREVCRFLLIRGLAYKTSRYANSEPYPLFSRSMDDGGHFSGGIDVKTGNKFLKGSVLTPQAANKLQDRLEKRFKFVFQGLND